MYYHKSAYIELRNTSKPWSIHNETLRQLNVERGENWILPLFHTISYHRAKGVLPLQGWERKSELRLGSFLQSSKPINELGEARQSGNRLSPANAPFLSK